MPVRKIVVLGAGVVGLSTAVNIQNSVADCQVTVVAEKFAADTTSTGAAGAFVPTIGQVQAEFSVFRQWCKDSFKWYDHLCRTREAPDIGILPVSGYHLTTEETPDNYLHAFRDFIYSFRELSNRELESMPVKHKYGWSYTTLLIECRRYLPWLMNMFEENGGKFIKRKISNVKEFVGTCDVLVNCSGFGSRELFNDDKVFAVKGHLIRVKAPWIKHFYRNGNDSTYLYPGQDHAIIGGSHQVGDYSDISTKDEEFDRILQRAYHVFPSLKDAEVIEKWAGLRPYRHPLRVEKDAFVTSGNSLKIVHNYGHGAHGVALSWGTAVHAARLVTTSLDGEAQCKL